MKLKMCVTALCALVLYAAPAEAAERISFTGVSSSGARQTQFAVPYPIETYTSFTDRVAGQISFDLSASGVTQHVVKGSSYTTVYYISSSPDFIKYSFSSTGLNPSPAGASIGGSVRFDYSGGDYYSIEVMAMNVSSSGRTDNDRGFVLTDAGNSLFFVLGGAGGFVDDASGHTIIRLSSVSTAFFTSLDTNTTTTFNGGVTTLGTERRSQGRATEVSSTLIASPAVPEPGTWAMMLIGFGMVCGAARYSRRGVKVSLA